MCAFSSIGVAQYCVDFGTLKVNGAIHEVNVWFL